MPISPRRWPPDPNSHPALVSNPRTHRTSLPPNVVVETPWSFSENRYSQLDAHKAGASPTNSRTY